ncbi:MAG: sigma-54-dependent Fis family transcriptional regulator, partial [Kofleriaceae bacterium]
MPTRPATTAPTWRCSPARSARARPSRSGSPRPTAARPATSPSTRRRTTRPTSSCTAATTRRPRTAPSTSSTSSSDRSNVPLRAAPDLAGLRVGTALDVRRGAVTRVLVVDDDRSIRRSLEKFLASEGLDVITAADGPEAMRVAPGADVILLDLGLPGADGFEVLRDVRAAPHPPPVIVVTARDDMQSTVKAIQLGAYEYLVKPIDIDRLRLVVRRAAESRDAERTLGQFVARESESFQVGNIIGRSAAIREVYKHIGAVSTSKASVLMLGESGTGKELVAKAIHYASADRDKPFVAINCTAFAPGVLESELFGHVKGAFTGAIGDKVGRFELAGAGTLFLDEIGELPLELQAKLLRVIQERTFERVGDGRPVPLRARIIAATHRDLTAMVERG